MAENLNEDDNINIYFHLLPDFRHRGQRGNTI